MPIFFAKIQNRDKEEDELRYRQRPIRKQGPVQVTVVTNTQIHIR